MILVASWLSAMWFLCCYIEVCSLINCFHMLESWKKLSFLLTYVTILPEKMLSMWQCGDFLNDVNFHDFSRYKSEFSLTLRCENRRCYRQSFSVLVERRRRDEFFEFSPIFHDISMNNALISISKKSISIILISPALVYQLKLKWV